MGCSMWVLGLLVLALVSNQAANAISCQEGLTNLLPCQPFLLGAGGITVPCCQGAQALNLRATSSLDRKNLCECFKRAAPAMGVQVERARQLPLLCKIKTVKKVEDFEE
ncbi:hypothetical protein RJ639_030927 [Escallonia herrerae]|uniref:Bifunctional inhibitor/plant lipid transfer protein/seed storage helical domain-containing protein n=1 Tax=Escallonia herrerae TaxID=1293975 RepID=A0AA89BHR8_9ASTE|nr:hypothetical protein RJ639_030927 [Escallonia herrerae]